MLGIIIISVVCCAVLTSIIWVVIIYQTRRRMNPAIRRTEEAADIDRTGAQQNQLQMCLDNVSEHSSCKDSGTGDSAKRSSDDLAPEEFTMIINGDAVIALHNSSHVPLLHDRNSTNHSQIVHSVSSSASAPAPKEV